MMDKEILQMILDTDKLSSEQKTEIILEMIEQEEVVHYKPYDFTPTVPDWVGPNITPAPYWPNGTVVTCGPGGTRDGSITTTASTFNTKE